MNAKSRIQALSLALGLVVLGSCDRQPLAPVTPPTADVVTDSGPSSDWLWGFNFLLRCTPLPVDSESQVIGPDGGSLTVGPHTFTVPAGALDTATLITAVTGGDSVNAIRFTPQGLVFQQPTTLVMSYANCGILSPFIPKRIAYTTDDFRILNLIPSIDDFLNRRVSGKVSHFSQYAIAW